MWDRLPAGRLSRFLDRPLAAAAAGVISWSVDRPLRVLSVRPRVAFDLERTPKRARFRPLGFRGFGIRFGSTAVAFFEGVR